MAVTIASSKTNRRPGRRYVNGVHKGDVFEEILHEVAQPIVTQSNRKKSGVRKQTAVEVVHIPPPTNLGNKVLLDNSKEQKRGLARPRSKTARNTHHEDKGSRVLTQACLEMLNGLQVKDKTENTIKTSSTYQARKDTKQQTKDTNPTVRSSDTKQQTRNPHVNTRTPQTTSTSTPTGPTHLPATSIHPVPQGHNHHHHQCSIIQQNLVCKYCQLTYRGPIFVRWATSRHHKKGAPMGEQGCFLNIANGGHPYKHVHGWCGTCHLAMGWNPLKVKDWAMMHMRNFTDNHSSVDKMKNYLSVDRYRKQHPCSSLNKRRILGVNVRPW